MYWRSIFGLVCCCFPSRSLFTVFPSQGSTQCSCHPTKDQQKPNTYHSSTSLHVHPAIYALNSSFRIYSPATNQSICNGIQYHSTVQIRTCRNQISGLYLSAILPLLTSPLPCKFTHAPSCEEMVSVQDCDKWHCKISSHPLSSPTLSDFSLARGRIDKIDSIQPMCTQSLV